MTTFTDVEAQSRLFSILEQARAEGEVCIRRPDGVEFVLRPAVRSPLDVGYVETQSRITLDDILDAIHDGHARA